MRIGGALGGGSALWTPEAAAQQFKITPEKGATLRVLRWNSSTPSRASSAAMARVTAVAEQPSRRPATAKPPASATVTKQRRVSR